MRILRYGSTGPQVSLAQLGLQRARYLSEEPDGIFGSRTRGAVQNFQHSSGLPADGIIGQKTWTALEPWLTGYRTVTVKPGDSFYQLAFRYGVSVRVVETANPGVDPLNLQVGQRLTVPLPFSVVPGNIPFTSTVLRYCVRGLRARYPFLRADSIGNSVLGTPLYLLQLGSGGNAVSWNAAHHANEWITSPLLMQYLEDYASAYVLEGQIGGKPASLLYRRSTLSLLPMVNPDGVDLVTGELAPGSSAVFSALSMNGSLEGFPLNWKANIRGVDLNLQYPAEWEEARRIKFAQGYTKPGPRDYVGPEPLSEPESRAVYTFTQKNDFRLTLSYHSQGEVIYWKFQDLEPPCSREIGQEMSRLSGYTLELTPAESAYAGYRDWFIQEFRRPGYTVEAGSGVNPLPISQLTELVQANEALLSYSLIATADPE